MTARTRRRPRAAVSDHDSGLAGGVAPRRRPIAFGLHQLFEYLVAVALVVLSVHIGRSHLLLIGGVILGVLALTARGPLGIVRVCGPRLHRALDVCAGVLLALAPLVAPLRPGVAGIVAVELAAVSWLRVAMLTRYPLRPERGERDTGAAPTTTTRAAAGGADPSSSPPASEPSTARTPPPQVLSVARGLGRMTATVKRRLPEAQSTLETGARQMGGQAGRLQRAWRRRGH